MNVGFNPIFWNIWRTFYFLH